MIEIKNVKKAYGRNVILDGVNFAVHEGDVISIIGPSGSGKTTLLRCINFLENADSGSIRIDDLSADFAHVHNKQKIAIRRKTAMVFQNYALFFNMTAVQNVMEGLIISKKMSKDEARTIAENILTKVGLGGKFDSKPHQLSGGQQQRVGIARAIALNPKVILFDEPTSALDPEMVDEIVDLIKQLASEGATMVIVTHEMQLAYEISSKVVFIANGNIQAEGPPKDIFDNPKDERLKQFISRFTPRRDPEYFL
ncbi:MAG: amino acid ABC transporter ATP-binding protein [Spirochaetaceae bacterium]|jgi:L-cystine transport system ATP-binding protein|nr:amino acid ABC transporter ATP-binding protein [Spirochaetaceae bacterium]